ncbi:recombinase family protein [Kitasatospora sp. NPDC059817]|uniref:recombinase family protein n=1 Tax=Kitasatospora sp. NPDC059817 TaxID=3346961 RepID=UPI003659103E
MDGPDVMDLYCRKSKKLRQGSHKQELSMDAQEARGRGFAAREGYRSGVVHRENLSAYKSEVRPRFDKALDRLHEGEAAALWSYNMSRFSRKGAGEVVGVLDAGKRLIFDWDGLDSIRPRDRKHIINAAEESREFSARLSEKVRDTKNEQRRQGRWLGAAPYGLKATTKPKLAHTEAATPRPLFGRGRARPDRPRQARPPGHRRTAAP